MDIVEICNEIARLKTADTTLRNCELLAVLYTVKNCLQDGTGTPVDGLPQYYEKSIGQTSDFVRTALNADYMDLLRVLDEHMENLREVFPKEYEALMRKLRAL